MASFSIRATRSASSVFASPRMYVSKPLTEVYPARRARELTCRLTKRSQLVAAVAAPMAQVDERVARAGHGDLHALGPQLLADQQRHLQVDVLFPEPVRERRDPDCRDRRRHDRRRADHAVRWRSRVASRGARGSRVASRESWSPASVSRPAFASHLKRAAEMPRQGVAQECQRQEEGVAPDQRARRRGRTTRPRSCRPERRAGSGRAARRRSRRPRCRPRRWCPGAREAWRPRE